MTIFERVAVELGSVTAMVLCHAESVDSGILDTSVESFDRQGRLGTPRYTAALIAFLLSADGGWVNGQLLKSDGGLSVKG